MWDAFIGGVVMGGAFSTASNAIRSGQYAQVGKSITDSNLNSLMNFASNSGDSELLSLAEDIANSETVSNKDKGKLAANVQQSIVNKMSSAKTEQELIGAYNNLTTDQPGYIISLANQVFVNKAAKVNMEPSAMMHTMKTVDGSNISADNANVNDISRSEQNVGEEQVYNNSGRLWGQDNNTQSGTGTVQEANGRVPRGPQENWGQQTGRERLYNQRNNRGITPEQNESLKTTAIKNDDGTPKTVCHFTDNMDFEVFAKGDVGFHFGTEQQALERGRLLKKTGRIIRAHLDIKNPLRISTDIMNWKPMPLAFKLLADNVITKEQYQQIEELQIQQGGQYDSPAAVELRRILADKGYDGIVYENMFEGEDDSYIAFYPEQVIIIDDGLNTSTEADSDESAYFSPENSDSGITELSAENPKYDMIEDIGAQMAGTVRKTDQQRLLEKIGKAFGAPVRFANLDETIVDENGNEKLFSPDGEFNEDTGVITLNTSTAVKHQPIKFVLKHELVHFGNTNKDAYKRFVNAVKDSKVFKAWLQQKTNMQGATTDAMLAKLNNDVRKQRARAGKPIGPEIALEEIIADFSGDVLFEKSGKPITALIESLQKPQRPLVLQYVVNAFEHLIGKLKGTNDGLTLELRNLQSNYVHMLKQAQKNTATQNSGGVKYAIKTDGQGNNYWQIETEKDIFKGLKTTAEYEKAARDFLLKNRDKKTVVHAIDGKEMTFIRISAEEFTNSEESKDLKANNPEMFGQKMRLIPSLEDLTMNANVNWQSPDLKNHKLFKEKGFENFRGKLRIDNIIFNYVVRAGKAEFGDVFYDINLEVDQILPHTNSASGIKRSTSKHSIPNSDENVKKYSVATEPTDTTDYTAEMDALYEQFRNGEIDRDEYIARVNELYEKAGETYGTIKKGEKVTGNENFDDPTPQKVNPRQNVRRYVRTIIEGGGLTDEMLTVTKEQILSGDVSYTPTSNEKNLKYAEKAILNGSAKGIWEKAANGEEKPSGEKQNISVPKVKCFWDAYHFKYRVIFGYTF